MEFKEWLSKLKLHTFSERIISVDVEEEIESITLAVLYKRHGDDYLYVKTNKGEAYTYGYFLDLKYPPDKYSRKTSLVVTDDVRAELSNRIFGCMADHFYDLMTGRPIKENSSIYAQLKFINLMTELSKFYSMNVYYNHLGEKDAIRKYLEVNNIYTEENKKILEKAKLHSKTENGVDGVAGKIYAQNNYSIEADAFITIYKNGDEQQSTDYEILESDEPDEFGYCFDRLDLDQFNDNFVDEVVQEITACATDISERLLEILDSCKKDKFLKRDLMKLRDCLTTMRYDLPEMEG